ncbi:hypothetical protein SUDANB105_07433 [Streptomyces sp. enrichment culture]
MNARVSLIDLDEQGRLLHPRLRTAVPAAEVPGVLESHLRLREETTDIFLHVHGWRTDAEAALDAATRLFSLIDQVSAGQPRLYPRVRRFRPQYVSVRWPSLSRRTPWGYRAIRERTAVMARSGQTARVLGSVLGYFNDRRDLPEAGPDVLETSYGQYLHCVGHSFGSRFLLHAVMEATRRLRQGGPGTLAWPWRDRAHPWTVDSLTLFQAALPADSFLSPPYARLLEPGILNAPIAMTYSPADLALGAWHRLAEGGRNGIGFEGATGPAGTLHDLALLPTGRRYRFPRTARLLNIDASACYRTGGLPHGAHSDYLHPESAHLLMSLAEAAR